MKFRCVASLFLAAAILIGITNIFFLSTTTTTTTISISEGPTPSSSFASCSTPITAASLSSSCPFNIQETSTSKTTATTTTTTTTRLNVTLFYNVFLPNLEHALEVVQEQFALIQKSYVAADGQNTIIYFNTMGDKAVEGWAHVLDLCRKASLSCVHLAHRQHGGDEIYTLQAMYDFCLENSNTDANDHSIRRRVGYLHNKGSFHDTPENAKLRVPFTKAVTSESCWNPPNQSCTSCGLVFLDLPFMTMPGNFFVSRCDYLIKLIPPLKFEAAQRQMLAAARVAFPSTFIGGGGGNSGVTRNATTFDSSSSFQDRDSWTGIGRYASEHWAHSHPDVVPCDLSQRLKVWFRPNPNQPMNFRMYPRPALEKFERNRPSVEFNDYYGIAGQVFKWYLLYDKVAPSDSWVWTRMRDGPVWRDGVATYGRNVTNVLPHGNVTSRSIGG